MKISNGVKLSPRFKIGIVVVLLIAFFVVLNLTAVSKGIKNFFYLISKPVQKTFWRFGNNLADFLEAVSNINKLKKEREELRLQNQELLKELVTLKEIREENKILREALDIGLEKEFKLQIAQVISKDISEDSLIIDRGSKEGLSEGLPVISQQKVLWGRISEVYPNFSRVMLISNKESSFDAKIADEEEIQGVVKGKGSLKIIFDLVPQEKEIEKGNLLITTSLGGIYPEGLLIGLVQIIKKIDIEPWQQAEIKPFFDIKEAETLFIITEW